MNMKKFDNFYFGTPDDTEYNYCAKTEECGLYDFWQMPSESENSSEARLRLSKAWS